MNDTLLKLETPDQLQAESGSSAPTCSPSIVQTAQIHTMARLGKELPEGTRIMTTQGGIPTGGTHEVNLENANGISGAFTDPRPFWCYAWRDLHDSLILPANGKDQSHE